MIRADDFIPISKTDSESFNFKTDQKAHSIGSTQKNINTFNTERVRRTEN